ncbi:MAG: sensor histidine kinase [Ekhidna sp.]
MKSSLEFSSSGSISTMLSDYLNAVTNGPEAAFLYSQEEKNIFSFASSSPKTTLSTISLLLESERIVFQSRPDTETDYISSKTKIFVYSKLKLESNGKTYFIVAVLSKDALASSFPYLSKIDASDNYFDNGNADIIHLPNYPMLFKNNLSLLAPLVMMYLFLCFVVYDIAQSYRILKAILRSLSEGQMTLSLKKPHLFRHLFDDLDTICNSFKAKNEELQKAAIEKQQSISKIDGIVESAQTIAHDTFEAQSIFKGLMEDSLEVLSNIKCYLKEIDVNLPDDIAHSITIFTEEYKQANHYVKYAFQLIRDLKKLDRIDQISFSQTEISTILSNLVQEIRILIPEHIILKVQFNHTKQVEVDRTMLLRIVYNILKNCIEASDYQSEVWIKTGDTVAGIDIKIGNTDSYIEPEDIMRLKSKNETGKSNGTGLGLFIADKLLKKHNASFDIVSSEEKQETEFIIHLKEFVHA